MVLQAAAGVHLVQTGRDRNAGIVKLVESPEQVVAVQAVLLHSQIGGLVRIVAEPLRVQEEVIEQSAVTVLGIYGKAAAKQAEAVPKIYVAAVLSEVAADFRKPVAGLEGIGYVVVAYVLAGVRTGLLGSGSHHLLRRERAGNRENPYR